MEATKNTRDIDMPLLIGEANGFGPNRSLTICCSEETLDSSCVSIDEDFCAKIPSADESPRDYRLFEQWVNKASGAISVFCRYSTPYLENFDPQRNTFVVRVDFDYNQRNYRPLDEAPEIVALERSNKSKCCFHNSTNTSTFVATGQIKYKDYMLTIPIFLDLSVKDDESNKSPDSSNQRAIYGQEQLRHKMFNDIWLNSSIFDRWDHAEKANRHKSYNHWMSNDRFARFMIFALHLPCSSPRHHPETSVVVIVISFGFALGQIEALDKFFVLPRMRAIENLQEWYHLTPRSRKRLEKHFTVDSKNDSIGTKVVLLAHASRKMFVQHFDIPLSLVTRDQFHPYVCDRKAVHHFAELQKRSPLPLESPCLNEIAERFCR